MKRRSIAAAPRVSAATDALAARVPARCPCGCRVASVKTVAGGDDRRPIAEVTFACGRVATVPEGVP